jgi:hypothetical protein
MSTVVDPARQRVPPEVWEEIFDDPARETILQCHLVDRLFHRITHPLLFRKSNCNPYANPSNPYDCSPASLRLLESAQVERELQRVQFWASDNIAPFVRVCIVSKGLSGPVYPSKAPRWKFSQIEDPYIILRAFFDSLPRFRNLRRLYARVVLFTKIGIQNLCLLTNLTHLELNISPVLDVLDASTRGRLAVSSLVLRHNRRDPRTMEQWFQILDPAALQHVQTTHNLFLFTTIASGNPFPSVQSLEIGWDQRTNNLNLEVLSKFPAVEALTVTDWRFWGHPDEIETLEDATSLALTSLKKYCGPHALFPLLYHIPTLHHLTFDDCQTSDFLNCLRPIRVLPHVTSLTLHFTELDTRALDELSALPKPHRAFHHQQ